MRIPVTAVDAHDHVVSNLTPNDLRLTDNGTLHPLTSLMLDEGPASILFVVDVSGSMKSSVGHVRDAIGTVLRHAQPDDEFAVIEFSGTALVTVPFDGTAAVERRLDKLNAFGHTSLVDAVVEALKTIRHAKYTRRAIIVVSDGDDTYSRTKNTTAFRLAAETDARIYAIEICPWWSEGSGPSFLESLSDVTGGRYLATCSGQKIAELIDRFDIHRYYIATFHPGAENDQRKDHRIDLKLTKQVRREKVRIYWKHTYDPNPEHWFSGN